jgi:hypothetical protein
VAGSDLGSGGSLRELRERLLSSTFTAFLVSVLVGARRFAHASLLRGDRALHALLGMGRFPTDNTICNLFRQFGMGQVQRLFEPRSRSELTQRYS